MGRMTTTLPIEYIGGPRDGDKSYLLRSSPRVPLRYPPEIKVVFHDVNDQTETVLGRYVHGGVSANGEAVRYIWASTHALPA